MKGFPDLPPLWLAGFCLLAWFLARELPIAGFAAPELRALGSALSVAGLVLIAWSAVTFVQAKTTIEPHETPQNLITSGPFRFSRNPIYLAMVVILAGWVLWLGGLSGVILPGIFASVLSLRFIVPEEARLEDVFGEAARTYFARTRRWL
ncbi:MAG: isoprenylcysteine carboxylmethyltransferase family protein [Pseudomonadota bacterium]